ncbi:MAG: biopolymer transporter ExbD [Xanthomonadaceae bacterium]|jgi:biopolymer transport protein ExbD|nr:biopolymer transporter ExbD [Xanthomonadaceae bacterium]
MRIRDERAYDEPEINLIPLIDVVLVLIIFFVITTTFEARSTLQLQLPVASDHDAPPPANVLNILINADGRYFIGSQELLRSDAGTVKQAIAAAAGDDREQPVLLRADANTPYQAVITAQDALAQLGFRRITIATAPEPKQ